MDRNIAWMNHAICKEIDPEMWFPEKGGATKQAIAICRGCPVQRDCLNYAARIKSPLHRVGIWGGLTERELRYIGTAYRSYPDPSAALCADVKKARQAGMSIKSVSNLLHISTRTVEYLSTVDWQDPQEDEENQEEIWDRAS